MFVEIEKDEMAGAASLDTYIKESRDDADGFTLDEALNILKKTNHYAVIKKVAMEIWRLKTPEERLAFKEFVISAMWGRVTSPDTFDLLYKLAVEGKYVAELLDAYSQPKVYKAREGNVLSKVFYVNENTDLKDYDFNNLDKAIFDFQDNSGSINVRNSDLPGICIFKNIRAISLSNADLSGVKEFKVENVENFDFNYCTAMPQKLDIECCKEVTIVDTDFSMCDKITLGDDCVFWVNGKSKLPKNMDLSRAKKLTFRGCDLSDWDNWNITGGEEINLEFSKNLPKILDLSGFDKVNLQGVDLTGVEKIIFKEGDEVDLSWAKNITCEINVDAPKKLSLYRCDLTEIEELKFKDGAEVDLGEAIFDASKVDFSVFDKLSIRNVDFSGVKELKFKDGANISIANGRNFPKVVDCSKVDIELTNCDFDGVEEIKFKAGDNVKFVECKNFPEVLDLSMYDKVMLKKCDLSSVKEIKLKEGCFIGFESMHGVFPKILDLSKAEHVKFYNCKIENIDEVKFRENSCCYIDGSVVNIETFDISKVKYFDSNGSNYRKVSLLKGGEGSIIKINWCYNYEDRVIFDNKEYVGDGYLRFPKVLDVSLCEDVSLDFSIKDDCKIIFKNRAQKDKALKNINYYKKNNGDIVEYKAKFRYVEGILSEALKKRKQQPENDK